MTKFLEPSFSTFAVGSDEYRDNWEQTFGKKKKDVEEAAEAYDDAVLEKEQVRTHKDALRGDRMSSEDLQAFASKIVEVTAKAEAGEYDEPLTEEDRVRAPFYKWQNEIREQLHDAIPKEIWEAFVTAPHTYHPLIAVWSRLGNACPWFPFEE